MDWTSIVLGVMTLLGGCGWVIDRKKHRQEVESLKADNRLKDMELAQIYVEQFENNIAEPLRHEVRELKDEVMELKNALERVKDCPHRGNCPVRNGMRKHAKRAEG